MGAQQSSGRDDSQGGETVKRCYYEVLSVERSATDDEIKKAYRKKALELHPDRNFGNVEATTAKFAEVQTAYEVLSDPQERAWYDSHRESILRGDSGSAEDHFEHDIKLTSAGDIVALISRFNRNTPFTDEPTGFYGILRETFANIAREEESACDWEGLEPIDYPDFGTSDDDYEDVVKPFYRVWINFTTKKTFSWRDAYRASDGPDRATRRAIEKENKRLRDEGIREFNDAVRHLVSFVRKRDPRYIPNSQTEADRQKVLRDIAAAQAARSRAENQAKLSNHIIPEWAQSQKPENEGGFSDSEPEEVEHIECVVCGKTFKSEKQYEAHEKSKKHIKAVQQLKREMQLENQELNLDTSSNGVPVSRFEKLDVEPKRTEEPNGQNSHTSKRKADDQHEASISKAESAPKTTTPKSQVSSHDGSSDSSDQDEDYASRNQVENRIANSLLDESNGEALDDSSTAVSASESGNVPKLGKAKQKRAKKLAKQEMGAHENQELKCVACQQAFASKTKLFDHIKKENHAQPLPKGKNKRK